MVERYLSRPLRPPLLAKYRAPGSPLHAPGTHTQTRANSCCTCWPLNGSPMHCKSSSSRRWPSPECTEAPAPTPLSHHTWTWPSSTFPPARRRQPAPAAVAALRLFLVGLLPFLLSSSSSDFMLTTFLLPTSTPASPSPPPSYYHLHSLASTSTSDSDPALPRELRLRAPTYTALRRVFPHQPTLTALLDPESQSASRFYSPTLLCQHQICARHCQHLCCLELLRPDIVLHATTCLWTLTIISVPIFRRSTYLPFSSCREDLATSPIDALDRAFWWP